MFDAATGFWQSEAGILERLGLLSDQVQLGTYNNAVKVFATSVGATDLRISGDITKNTCGWCAMHVGMVYHRGQFSPILPKHPNCVHFYEILRVGAQPEIEAKQSAFEKFYGEEPATPQSNFGLFWSMLGLSAFLTTLELTKKKEEEKKKS